MEKDLTLVLAAKDTASGAVKGLTGNLGKLGKTTGTAGKGFANMGGKIAGVGKAAGLAAGGGLLALTAGLGLAVKAAAEEQIGVERMSTALAANDKAFKGNTDAIEAVIRKRGDLGFADDALRDSLSKLVVATKDTDEALRLQTIAMDLARAKNIDLDAASQIVMKTFNGQTAALKKLGLVIEPVTTAQDALRASGEKFTKAQMEAAKASDEAATKTAALGAIQKATAGQSEKFAGTAAGAWEAFQIKMGNIVEDIGAVLLPAVTEAARIIGDEVFPVIQNIAAEFGKWVDNNKPLIDQITDFVAGALANLAGFLTNDLPTAIAAVVGAVDEWMQANEPLIQQIRDVLNVALQALGDGIKWAQENMNIVVPFIAGPLVLAFTAWAVSATAAAVATAAAMLPIIALGVAVGALAVLISQNWDEIVRIVGSAIERGKAQIDEFVKVIQSVAAAIEPIVREVARIFGEVVAVVEQAAKDIAAFVEDTIKIILNIADAIIPVVAGVGDVVRGVIDFFIGDEGLVPKIRDAAEDIIAFVTGIPDGIGKSLGEFTDAAGKIVQAFIDGFVNLPGMLLDTITGAFRDAFNNLKIDVGPFHIRASGITIDMPTIDLPKFAEGSWSVPKNMAAIVHKGEMIVPSRIAEGVRSGAVGIGGQPSRAGAVSLNTVLNVSGADDPERWASTYVRSVARRLRREGLIA